MVKGHFRTYLTSVESSCTYSCLHCRAHLARHEDLISKSFQGSQGRAYLFHQVVNVGCTEAKQRVLLTGLHFVADIYCSCCGTMLGWKYERAFEVSQRYKEGKVIIELAHLIKDNGWDSHLLEFQRKEFNGQPATPILSGSAPLLTTTCNSAKTRRPASASASVWGQPLLADHSPIPCGNQRATLSGEDNRESTITMSPMSPFADSFFTSSPCSDETCGLVDSVENRSAQRLPSGRFSGSNDSPAFDWPSDVSACREASTICCAAATVSRSQEKQIEHHKSVCVNGAGSRKDRIRFATLSLLDPQNSQSLFRSKSPPPQFSTAGFSGLDSSKRLLAPLASLTLPVPPKSIRSRHRCGNTPIRRASSSSPSRDFLLTNTSEDEMNDESPLQSERTAV